MSNPSLRARALTEWRGLPQAAPERDRCKSVASILEVLLPKLGLNEQIGEENIRAAWLDVVGDFISRHASPVGLSGGVLWIQVLQPSLRYELERNWKKHILQRLQDSFGRKAVREVKFRL
jgi:hypothetical protein